MSRRRTFETHVAIYTRVSTARQTTENQLEECSVWSERLHPELRARIYSDVAGVSGRRKSTRKRDQRPGLSRMIEACERGIVVRVIVAEVSRLARDIEEGIHLLAHFRDLKCPVWIVRGGRDTSTPRGWSDAMTDLTSAEYESLILSERTKAGLERSEAQGGRPRIVTEKQQRRIVTLRSKHWSWSRIASSLKLPRSTVRTAFERATQ